MVSLKVEGKMVDFMIDTGAERSVLTQSLAPFSKETVKIAGATGKVENTLLLQAQVCNLGNKQVTHQFLYVPECLIPLLGRDLLSKLHAHITFPEGGEVNATLGGA